MTFLILFTQQSFAWTAVAVSDSKNATHTVFGYREKAEVETAATQGCNENYKTDDCRIFFVTTGAEKIVAVVSGAGPRFFAASDNSLDKTIDAAIVNCNKKTTNCKLGVIAWDGVSPFAAVGMVDGQQLFETIRIGLDPSEAKEHALDACKQISRTPEKCTSSVYDSSIFYAAAFSVKDSQKGYSSVGYSKLLAEKDALKGCREGFKTDCKVILSFQSSAKAPIPKDVQKKIDELNAINNASLGR